MQHHVNSNAATSSVQSSPARNRASARLARLAGSEAALDIQLSQARNFSNLKPAIGKRINRIEQRAPAQGSAPRASIESGHGEQQLSTRARPAGMRRFRKSRIISVASLALMLPSLVGLAVWISVFHSPLADISRSVTPLPVLTAPAFLEATVGESLILPISLDGTDGVPAQSTIAITGLPQGSMLSKGQPLGDGGWKLDRDEIGDLRLVVANRASGQGKITIQLIAPDAIVVADTETVLKVAAASFLPPNAPPTNLPFPPSTAELTFFGMSHGGVSRGISNAQLTQEAPEVQPDPAPREAKPSTVATARAVEPVRSPQIADARDTLEGTGQPDPGLSKPSVPSATESQEEPAESGARAAQSQRRASAKRTIAHVGSNEVKTSVFINLRQAPSPSAEVIRVVAKDTKLRVLTRKGRWLQVTNPATSEKGWIYAGNTKPTGHTKSSAPSEPTQDTQERSDSVWPSFLRGLASR
jgi:hypothetical protein